MSATFVQAANGFGNSPFTSIDVAFSSGNTAGSAIIVYVQWGGGSGNLGGTPTDSKGNTYTQVQGPTEIYGTSFSVYIAKNVAAGANTVSVANTTAVNVSVSIAEFSGVDITTPVLAFNYAGDSVLTGGYSFAPAVSITIGEAATVATMGGANAAGTSGTLAPSAGQTQMAVINPTGGNGNIAVMTEYIRQTGAGTYGSGITPGGVSANDWWCAATIPHGFSALPLRAGVTGVAYT